jgi:hypothetical protein
MCAVASALGVASHKDHCFASLLLPHDESTWLVHMGATPQAHATTKLGIYGKKCAILLPLGTRAELAMLSVGIDKAWVSQARQSAATYVAYRVCVKTARRSWHVERSFADFTILHRALSRALSADDVPQVSAPGQHVTTPVCVCVCLQQHGPFCKQRGRGCSTCMVGESVCAQTTLARLYAAALQELQHSHCCAHVCFAAAAKPQGLWRQHDGRVHTGPKVSKVKALDESMSMLARRAAAVACAIHV